MKRTIIYTIFILGFYSLYAQQETDTLINYSKDRMLQWSDFKGKAREDQAFDAMTEWGMKFSYNYDGNYFNFTLVCQFNKYESWAKDEKKTDELLRHEQLHFDIAELFTRKMRKELLTTKYKMRTVYKVVNDIHEDHYMACNRYQKLYDKESMFSTHEKNQAEWEKKVAKELKSLSKYSKEHYSFESKETK